jgi:hypothetical protein
MKHYKIIKKPVAKKPIFLPGLPTTIRPTIPVRYLKTKHKINPRPNLALNIVLDNHFDPRMFPRLS